MMAGLNRGGKRSLDDIIREVKRSAGDMDEDHYGDKRVAQKSQRQAREDAGV